MSQRAAKMESIIQHTVANALVNLLERDAAGVTVTRVDAAGDMRNATVWVGLLGDEKTAEKLWLRIEGAQGILHSALGGKLTTKFIPRLHFRRDTGGAYAAEIDKLLRGL
jgi:ribosome-binding factor A